MTQLIIERDADGIPTEAGSGIIKQALKQFWGTHGYNAVLSQPLQEIADANPLEASEASEEFDLYGMN